MLDMLHCVQELTTGGNAQMVELDSDLDVLLCKRFNNDAES